MIVTEMLMRRGRDCKFSMTTYEDGNVIRRDVPTVMMEPSNGFELADWIEDHFPGKGIIPEWSSHTIPPDSVEQVQSLFD